MSLVNGIKHLPVEFSPSEPVLTAWSGQPTRRAASGRAWRRP